ncbi:hypothetical protein [Amycolatopsis minnesotensis]|uniref:Uncharacterized protein n=1 Tax=Amycolatopsis minnesotensis TaxID=337894 RepID=A0ABP5DUR8_9PSEU
MPDTTLRFHAEHIAPGTAYPDEPTESIPPRWYVFGRPADNAFSDTCVVISIEQALDETDDQHVRDGEIATAIATALNGVPDPFATSPAHPCPPCAADGGYGTTVAGQRYHCPDCGTQWSQWPDGGTATTPWGNWWERMKVRLF